MPLAWRIEKAPGEIRPAPALTPMQTQPPRIKEGPGSARAWRLLLAGFLVGGLLSAGWAQFGAAGKILGFKLPDFYEAPPGTPRPLKTLITGAEAQPDARGIIAVKVMRIETYEKNGATNIIARAPQCYVDSGSRVVWSAGRLEMATADGQFFTEGNEGFYCRMNNTMLILSNRVRTVIARQVIQGKATANDKAGEQNNKRE